MTLDAPARPLRPPPGPTGPGPRPRPVLTTPRRYRAASVAAGVVLVAMLAAGLRLYVNGRDATGGLRRNTGPVLAATQSLVASLAEADAAATAAFLSGRPEDRDQRNLYQDALARAEQQLEQVSALIGNDAQAHALLQDLGVKVTRYAGLVETARTANANGLPGAGQSLVGAVNLLSTTVASDAGALTSISERRFSSQVRRRSAGEPLAVGVAVVALAGLVAAQVDLARRSRRLINVPLLLSSLAVAATLAWMVGAGRRAGDDLAAARRDGYNAIVLTATIQTEAFGAKSNETLALITGDPSKRSAADQAAVALAPGPITPEAIQAARLGRDAGVGGLLGRSVLAANSARKRAATAELLVRWERYRAGTAALRQSGGDAARRLAVGDVSSAFNGFNVSVESVLSDNRTEFAVALRRAGDRYRGLAVVVSLGAVVALATVLGGYQLRINEYR